MNAFTAFDEAHGFAVNLFVVIALAAIGAGHGHGLAPGAVPRRRGDGRALPCATWVLVQDFGFFGGLGTDPNSMIPMALGVSSAATWR